MTERQIFKRHKWNGDTCERCGMTREFIYLRRRAGCFGSRMRRVRVYRYRNGREAWLPSGNVPSCNPTRGQLS